ncbi:unnamed protein product [Effrenium voratum]|nr:unnamed protein product [Effrenium voratum]
MKRHPLMDEWMDGLVGWLNFRGNAEELFMKIDADASGFVTLYEVDSKCADLWAAFRAWCADTFSSPEELVTQLRGSIVELGPPEGERRVFKKQKSAVPPVERAPSSESNFWKTLPGTDGMGALRMPFSLVLIGSRPGM